MALAYLQLRLILSKIIWNFDMEIVEKMNICWDRDVRMFSTYLIPSFRIRFSPKSSIGKLEAIAGEDEGGVDWNLAHT